MVANLKLRGKNLFFLITVLRPVHLDYSDKQGSQSSVKTLLQLLRFLSIIERNHPLKNVLLAVMEALMVV